jgi:thioredoxin-related protein
MTSRRKFLRTLGASAILIEGVGLAPVLAADAPAQLAPGMVNPGYQDPPKWFKDSFLDIREEIAAAKTAGRRLMLYFYQDGCPYCTKLLTENFARKEIADKTRKYFDVIAINIWGDREVTDNAGTVLPEKAFAKALGVQFTPTLLMLDEQGVPALRLNGYVPPHKFETALDFAGQRLEKRQKYTDYMQANAREPASGKLHAQPWLMPEPLDLGQRAGNTMPLMVLFEQKVCAACDEMHGEGFSRPEVTALIKRFRVARVDIASPEKLKTPAGESLAMRDWARKLNVVYTPSIAFFDVGGREVFRVEGYLRPFHLASSLDYVASGEYRKQPEFQRYIEARAAARRQRGEPVELWK